MGCFTHIRLSLIARLWHRHMKDDTPSTRNRATQFFDAFNH